MSYDGNELSVGPDDHGWRFSSSEFPIGLSSDNTFSVTIRNGIPHTQTKASWSVCVGLVAESAAEPVDIVARQSLVMYSDCEIGRAVVDPASQSHIYSRHGLPIKSSDWPKNTTVTVTYFPGSNSTQFTANGHQSQLVTMPEKTVDKAWFPFVGILPIHEPILFAYSYTKYSAPTLYNSVSFL